MSGTSMAAPHVAGAVALFAANTPGATPADVRGWLRSDGSRPQDSPVGFSGDPDGSPEPVLNLLVGNEARQSEPAPTRLAITGYAQSGNSNSAKLADDRDPMTAWVTGTAKPPRTAYALFDLGARTSVTEILWRFKRTGFADRFRIQVSDDRQTWTTVATRGNATAGTWQRLAIGREARYVRFFFTNPNDDPRLGFLAEVEIRGVAT